MSKHDSQGFAGNKVEQGDPCAHTNSPLPIMARYFNCFSAPRVNVFAIGNKKNDNDPYGQPDDEQQAEKA